LLRAEGLANERRLTEITLDFCRRLGIEALVLPMSDDPVRTNVLTDDGAMTFQQYYNELGCDPAVRGCSTRGPLKRASPTKCSMRCTPRPGSGGDRPRQSVPRHPPDPRAERHARAAPQARRAGDRVTRSSAARR